MVLPRARLSERHVKAEEPLGDEYVIKGGDTLFSIARINNVTVDDLKKWNHLASDLILAGESIAIKASAAKPKPKLPGIATATKPLCTCQNKTSKCSSNCLW